MNRPNPSTDTIRITLHEKRVDGERIPSIKDGDCTRSFENPYGGTQPYLSIVGNGTITATETDNQSITVSIDPPIETSIDFTDIEIYESPNVRTTGRLLASAADGNTMSITAIDALAPCTGDAKWNASATSEYLVTYDEAVLRETKNLKSLYITISLP